MRLARYFVLWSLLFCLAAMTAQARPKGEKSSTANIESQAYAHYQKGEYADAFAAYRKGANMGSAKSQTFLGYMYADGRGTKKDLEQAFEWMNKAADQDYATAEVSLGLMYQDGLGTAKDYGQALTWFSKAARKGSSDAENDLGVLYYHGLGTTQDYPNAFAWFNRAAQQGLASAENSLGFMYYTGRGTAQNYEEVIPAPSKASAGCIWRVWERGGITHRRSPGSVNPRSRASLWPKTISA